MNETGTQHMSVQHQLLRVLRVVWVGFALIVVWAVVRGATARYLELITVSEDAAQFVGQLTPADASQLATLGLAARQYAAYFTMAETATALIFIAMAWLIFLRRPRDWFALFVATFFCLASVVLPIGSALQRSGILDPMVLRSIQVGFSFCFVAFPFLFPDGTPVPRWSLGVIVVSLVYGVVGMAVPGLLPPAAFGAGLTADQIGPLAWLIGMFALGVAAQSYRYRSVATAIQRQQTKWIVYGLCACLGLALLGIIVVNASSIPDGRVNYMALRIAGPTLILAGAVLIPLTIGFSVLRYRLWDIDLIVRKTLIYSILTALMGLIYFGAIVLLQDLFGRLAGVEQSTLAVVISTLAIAALFRPLRRRIQEWINRRFFRKKYDAQQVLAQFALTARDETDLDALTAELAHVVQETMQPKQVSIWLRESK